MSLATALSASAFPVAASLASAPEKSAADIKATERLVTPRLIAEKTTLIAGKTNILGVTFEIPKDWHVYWNGQSDSGLPMNTEWELPGGFTAEPQQWPAPVRHVSPGEILDHVYFDRVTLISPIAVSADVKPGPITLKAKLKWLVCKDGCIPEKGEVSITLPVAAFGESLTDSPDAAMIQAARERLPIPAPSSAGVMTTLNRGSDKAGAHLTISVKGATELTFFPDSGEYVLAMPIEQATASGETLSMDLELLEKNTPVSGVLEVKRAEAAAKTAWYQLTFNPPGPAGTVDKK